MNRLPVNPQQREPRRRIPLRDRRTAPPLALPCLPGLTARLALARPLTRTDILRRANYEPVRHR
ncbi:MAG TPA: hypothetical protein VKB09_07760 [Thermomicrobiales bacterium]|nr:hypothetical protein [Thermomicrobiales bacterium]